MSDLEKYFDDLVKQGVDRINSENYRKYSTEYNRILNNNVFDAPLTDKLLAENRFSLLPTVKEKDNSNKALYALERMKIAINTLGKNLIFTTLSERVLGDSNGYGLIRINDKISYAEQAGVIAHELGHEILHPNSWRRTIKFYDWITHLQLKIEAEAEGVSYVVMRNFDITQQSDVHVLMSQPMTVDFFSGLMLASSDNILKAAKEIIEAAE